MSQERSKEEREQIDKAFKKMDGEKAFKKRKEEWEKNYLSRPCFVPVTNSKEDK